MDAPLSATLQFSTPITNTISQIPAQNAEIHRKLKKTQKALPSFGWDTEPVIGSEEVIEECFVDVFCDLIYGSGWMDLERGEDLNRDCNWALVSFLLSDILPFAYIVIRSNIRHCLHHAALFRERRTLGRPRR